MQVQIVSDVYDKMSKWESHTSRLALNLGSKLESNEMTIMKHNFSLEHIKVNWEIQSKMKHKKPLLLYQ